MDKGNEDKQHKAVLSDNKKEERNQALKKTGTSLSLRYDLSVEENASIYFEKSKKAKKKIEGAKDAVELLKKRLLKMRKDLDKNEEEKLIKDKRKKEWYEKFRWFFTSEGFLVIGGRDSTTNEIIIKKHLDKDDLVFHTDMSGSPFFVIKKGSAGNKEIGPESIREAAFATASFSRAWTKGLSSLATFYVHPDQVSKTPNPGEYLSKGSFMIRGKTNYVDVKIEVALGLLDNIIISGPLSAIRSRTEDYVIIQQGDMKKSDIAKKLSRMFKTDIDEIMHMLPPGTGRIITKELYGRLGSFRN